MRTPNDLRVWAAQKYRGGYKNWLGHDGLGERLEMAFPLQPPTEAAAGSCPADVAAWAQVWRAFDIAGVTVDWVRRRWTSYGVQELPLRARVTGASSIALLAGERASWSHLKRVTLRLREAWPGEAVLRALPGAAGGLGKLDDADVELLIAVVDWFLVNPDSGLLSRQVAVPGVHTKWLETHQGLVERLVGAITGIDGLGLRKEPRRFRVRVLDTSIAGGMLDFTAPTSELLTLSWRPRCVLICENLQCLAALTSTPGLVALHGNGYAATELAGVDWVNRTRVLYWGDLDSHGFAILGRLRATIPQVESVLMDEATLDKFGALAVAEPQPYRGYIGHLTASERRALVRLRDDDRRLEQERIDWGHAFAQLQSEIVSAPTA